MASTIEAVAQPTQSDSTRYEDAFPNSRKIHVDGTRGIRVPMREISLAGGERPLRVYDPSGPELGDVRRGLPSVRDAWIRGREVEPVEADQSLGLPMPGDLNRTVLRGNGPVTQTALRAARGGHRGDGVRCDP